MVFCFEILHYKTAQDTIQCVESICRMNDNCEIVIVDNGSNNGSIELVKDKYKEKNNLHIIINDHNLGFAAGNNIGYIYAREHIHADFIVACNNDLIFDDTEFISKCVNIYKKTGAYVIGPDIQSLMNNSHQSPMKKLLKRKNDIIKEIIRYTVLLWLSKAGLYDHLWKTKNNKQMNKQQNNRWEVEQTNVVLHGAAVIFTPIYILNEALAFQPGTFLYMEEEILSLYLANKKYLSVYTPEIHVFHKEDSSTNTIFKARKDKREFVFRNMIKSLKVYKNI